MLSGLGEGFGVDMVAVVAVVAVELDGVGWCLVTSEALRGTVRDESSFFAFFLRGFT